MVSKRLLIVTRELLMRYDMTPVRRVSSTATFPLSTPRRAFPTAGLTRLHGCDRDAAGNLSIAATHNHRVRVVGL